MSFTIPVQKLTETKNLLAFYHPKPVYPIHILLVPKKEKADLSALGVDDQEFMVDLFLSVQDLVQRFNLEQMGYRLVVNGGDYQEFPYLHFHLISGENIIRDQD